MDNKLYLLLRKAAIKEYEQESISEIMASYSLDYRTARGLSKIINNEEEMSINEIERLSNPNFYNMENMIALAKQGLIDIIPYEYFGNEEFLEKTGIDYLPDDFLSGCSNLNVYNMSDKINKIGDRAFAGCDFLIRVSVSPNLKTIGREAFKNCSSLRIINNPNGVRWISSFGNHQQSYLPDSVTYIGQNAFKGCSLITSFIYPKEALHIEDGVFKDCTGLEIFYSDNVMRAGKESFAGCSNLSIVKCVFEEVGEECFRDCISLNEISLSAVKIHKRAFSGCKLLENIYFKNGIAGGFIKKDAFIGCSGLENINLDGFSYQIREVPGFNEIIKNVRPTKTKTGKSHINCSIHAKNSVRKILETT